MSRSTFECSLNMISLFASWEYVGFRIWSKIYSLRHWISVNKNTYRHHGWCHILFLFWIQQVRFFIVFCFLYIFNLLSLLICALFCPYVNLTMRRPCLGSRLSNIIYDECILNSDGYEIQHLNLINWLIIWPTKISDMKIHFDFEPWQM